MTLAPGSRVGPYEVVSALGAGGMGEVYRARDTNLNREVAIKVLPSAFAADAERVARFRREAQILASLNHPGIAAIYGLEEAGGVVALALKLVEGDDLAQRLARGAIPLEEALAIARQIAEALEAAHEKGIVHRDLKPANVKVTPDGKVKVLDFGLAKAFAPEGVASGGASDLTNSPTMTHRGTEAGMILGTAAYMSPEQARGKPVDRRSDLWSFGVLLHEMLTGRRLFDGETVSDVLAAVLTREADLSALPPGTPPSVRRLLRRCLQRDRGRRLDSAADARLEIEDAASLEGAGAAPVAAPRSRRLVLAGAAIGLALFAAGWLLRPAPRAEAPAVRMLDLAVNDMEASLGRMPSISPDGSRMAYVSGAHLRVRRLDRLEAVELDGDDIRYVAWSPDGRELAYVRKERAWRVSADGGVPVDLGAVPGDLVGSGGSVWTADGKIVFAGSDTVGLWTLPAAGGPPSEILKLNRGAEADFHEISELPLGRGLIFTVHRKGTLPDEIGLFAAGSRRVLLEVPGESLRHPVYSRTGHILYERETTTPGIWAVPFSLDGLKTTGRPFLVVPGGMAPSVSRDGTLCFTRSEESPVELVRVSRGGAVESAAELPGLKSSALARMATGGRGGGHMEAGLRLSPDGSRVAVSIGNAPGQLSVYDVERGSLSAVASGTFPFRPLWTPDGLRLLYASSRGSRAWNVWSRRADAAGEEERVLTSDEVQMPLALSPDGGTLVYAEGTGAKESLRRMPWGGEAKPSQLFIANVSGGNAAFSPDGRFLAYESLETGRFEVYARTFPEGDERFALSTGGGEMPVWSKSGEVFFFGGGGISAVPVRLQGKTLAVGKPVLLFPTGGQSQLTSVFDATPDGQHFVMLRAVVRVHVSMILNFPREIDRLGR